MKRLALLLILLLPMIARAQTPGTLQYPTALDTPCTLYTAANFARTTLTASINSSATTIAVTTTTFFPSCGSALINGVEIVSWTSKTSTALIGATRGLEGTAAVSHVIGGRITQTVTADYHNKLATSIISLQTNVGIGDSPAASAATGTCRKKNSDGTVTWQTCASGGSGAPTDATYITQTANGSLSNEQALGSLATGIVKNTTTSGVLSIATLGTDYAKGTGTTNTLPMFTATGTIGDSRISDDGTTLNLGSGSTTYLDLFNSADPSAPASGSTTCYTVTSALIWKCRDSAGNYSVTVRPDAGASNNFLTAIGTDGVPAKAQPSFSNISGTIAAAQNTVSVLDGSVAYCADAGANDTYTCSLSPAPAGYVTGARYRFKANTANTGASTINLNSLGAKTIKKAAGGITTDLADNDVRVGQLVDLVYDGTNMQMQSTLGNAAGGSGTVTSVSVDAQRFDVASATTTPAVTTKAVNAAGNITGATTINWNSGVVQSGTLTGNVTFTFSNPTNGQVYRLVLTQDSTGGRTITWPGTVRMAGGITPAVNSAASSVSTVEFIYDGTNYTTAVNTTQPMQVDTCTHSLIKDGSNYRLINNRAGTLVGVSTDAGVVGRIGMNAAANGHLCTGDGEFLINTLGHDTTGGLDTFYGLAFPANSGTAGKPGVMTLSGAGMAIYYETIDTANNRLKPVGTMFRITPAAMATVTSDKKVACFYQLRDSGSVGNLNFLNNVSCTFPDNSRGNLAGADWGEAIGSGMENVSLGFDQDEDDLVVPSASTFGSYGVITQNSSKIYIAQYRNVFTSGFGVGFDINTEHSDLYNCGTAHSSYPWLIAERTSGAGGVATTYHPITLDHFHDAQNVNGGIIYNNLESLNRVEIRNYDLEVDTGGIWARTTDTTEETPGHSQGTVTWTTVQASVGNVFRPFFQSGHGLNWGPYKEVAFNFVGVPAASALGVYKAPQPFSFASAFLGSICSAEVAATAQTDFLVKVNGTTKATLRFAASGTTCSVVSGTTTRLATGDKVTITAPASPDATLADVAITLLGKP